MEKEKVKQVQIKDDVLRQTINVKAVELVLPHSVDSPILKMDGIATPGVQFTVGKTTAIMRAEDAEDLGYMILQVVSNWRKGMYINGDTNQPKGKEKENDNT